MGSSIVRSPCLRRQFGNAASDTRALPVRAGTLLGMRILVGSVHDTAQTVEGLARKGVSRLQAQRRMKTFPCPRIHFLRQIGATQVVVGVVARIVALGLSGT